MRPREFGAGITSPVILLFIKKSKHFFLFFVNLVKTGKINNTAFNGPQF